jgi:hypothetical protein
MKLSLSCCSSNNEAPTEKLNHKNILNLLAYIVNIVLTYGIGNAGWIGTPDNGELSDKYQTIVTPNSRAFSIWAVIFVFQAIFAVAQMLPRFRAVDMVQKGVGYWYCLVCAMQIGWTFTVSTHESESVYMSAITSNNSAPTHHALQFAYEIIEASLTCMLLLWLSLIGLLYSQYYAKSDNSLVEFWLLRFPFAIHAGWITAASALNVNVLVVSMDQPANIQLAVAIISLAVLHAISVWVLFNIPRPNWTIACVLSWAFGWIYYELQEPNDLIKETFAADIISGVAYAAIAVAVGIIPLQMLIRLSLLIRPSWNPYKFNRSEQRTEPEAEVNADEDMNKDNNDDAETANEHNEHVDEQNEEPMIIRHEITAEDENA